MFMDLSFPIETCVSMSLYELLYGWPVCIDLYADLTAEMKVELGTLEIMWVLIGDGI